jgi:CheY-like chemotaxis protein
MPPNKLILLIEHEAGIREVLRTCLSELGGWQVTFSDSIRAGLDLCSTVAPDVILLDASTTEPDALLFSEQLKQMSIAHSIPILVISARANWFTALELNQMGFAGAITKPFNPATIAAQVAHMLEWNNSD